MTIITHLIALLVGGAGGYLLGARVKAAAAKIVTDVKQA